MSTERQCAHEGRPKVEIIGTADGAVLHKRLNLPGVEVKTSCPKCGRPWVRNLAEHHLSSPVVGQPSDLYGYCQACEHEWSVKVILSITLKVAE